MKEQEYIREVLRTYGGPHTSTDMLNLGALGLAGEIGEVVDIIKKFVYQGHTFDEGKMCNELGDILWYFMLIAHTCNLTLEEIMQRNVEKLRKRYPYGFDPERSVNRYEGE